MAVDTRRRGYCPWSIFSEVKPVFGGIVGHDLAIKFIINEIFSRILTV